jgi:hypothetical protein
MFKVSRRSVLSAALANILAWWGRRDVGAGNSVVESLPKHQSTQDGTLTVAAGTSRTCSWFDAHGRLIAIIDAAGLTYSRRFVLRKGKLLSMPDPHE